MYNHKMPYKHQIDVPMTNISGIFRMSHLKLNGSKQLGFINFHRTEWIMSFKQEFCVEKKIQTNCKRRTLFHLPSRLVKYERQGYWLNPVSKITTFYTQKSNNLVQPVKQRKCMWSISEFYLTTSHLDGSIPCMRMKQLIPEWFKSITSYNIWIHSSKSILSDLYCV